MIKTLLTPIILLSAYCAADVGIENIETYPVVDGQFEEVVYINKGSIKVDADGVPLIAVDKDSYWIGHKDFDVNGQCMRKTATLVRMNVEKYEAGVNEFTPILTSEVSNVPCPSS